MLCNINGTAVPPLLTDTDNVSTRSKLTLVICLGSAVRGPPSTFASNGRVVNTPVKPKPISAELVVLTADTFI